MISVCRSEDEKWRSLKLKEFSDYRTQIEYCHQMGGGYGDPRGEWFWIDPEVHEGKYRVIYSGIFLYEPPGHYQKTFASLYEIPGEFEQFELDGTECSMQPDYL